MGKIVEFFLNRPILVNLIIIAVVGLGIKSAVDAQKEGFPEISLNKITIVTIYPGASAKDVELNVTIPIEDALDEVEGIKEILSISEEGISTVSVQADDNATDDEFQEIYTDVDNALSKIDDLPGDIDGRPSISKFTSKDIPIMEIAFDGPYDKLRSFIPHIESRLKKVKGVASVKVIGLPDEEIQILVDPVKAKKEQVDLGTISRAIQKRNLEGSGGTLESFIGEKKIVSFNKFKKYNDVLDTNIIMSHDGYGVKLKQVASIKKLPMDMKLLVRNNGKRGVVINIKKKTNDDIIKTVNRINSLLTESKKPEEIKITSLVDQSKFTKARLNLLMGNAIIGFILVSIILLIIFDKRTALWTAFGIPFSLLGVFIYLKNTGMSLNLISLGGFIIVIGMLVDDAIVISEEINSNREKGIAPKDAAVRAVKKMWIPVMGSSLTTMIAFSPLLSIGGMPGKFIWVIPIMVFVALSISLFESFFILPAHLFHGKTRRQEKKPLVVKFEKVYHKILSKAIKFKYPVLLGFIILLFVSIITISKFVTKEPFPQDAAEGFQIKLTLPRGSSQEKTRKEIIRIEKILLKLPKKEMIGFSSRIGTLNELTSTDRGTQNNIAIIFVYLKPLAERKRTAREIIDSIRMETSKSINSKKITLGFDLKRMGPPMGKPFEIRIISSNDRLRDRTEQEIRKFLSGIKGVYDLDNDETEGEDEWDLVINHDILSQTGLTVEDVLTTLRIAFDGMIVTDMIHNGKKIDFRLRLNRKGRGDIHFIQTLPILNRQGRMINLKAFVSLKEQPARGLIHHIDGKRAVTLFGNVDVDIISPLNIMKMVQKKFHGDEKVEIAFSGQPDETKKIFGDLGAAAVTALIGVFLLISLIFNSFKRPFIILLTIPFGIIGISFALVTHNLPLSLFAGISMVGLLGIIVNDSIIMVHTITDKITNGNFDNETIITGAVSRLRPILLTTITTTLGILPTGYGIGGYDPFLSDMCIALAYGLLFGTVAVMFLVPIYYSIGIDIGRIKIFQKDKLELS